MRISFIGAGRVASHLAKAFNAQHEIIDIYSRSIDKVKNLATQLDSHACQDFTQMQKDIDMLVIAVSDQSISSVIQEIAGYFQNVLIVHTSGSTHIDVLKKHHAKSGVFYPLQTFSFEREIDWANTPIFIEAQNDADLQLLNTLATQISQRVYEYDSAQRLSLHLAAVFACNFSNYCYDIAKQVVDAKQVDFSLLYPLILETANKATQNDPRIMQTGPAMRGDHNILDMHQHMLEDTGREDLKLVYETLSQAIMSNQLN